MKKLRLKITLSVAVLLCALVLNAADAQSLTFSMENTTIENVMDRIEQESDYTFLVLDRAIALNKGIASIEVNDASIDQAVGKMLAGTGISHNIMDRQILLTNARQARETTARTTQSPQDTGRTVTGTVIDDAGEAIIGAMITVQGTSTASITDNNGAFSIRVPANAVLSVSFYGYVSQDVPVGDQTTVNVVMQTDSQLMEDVIVVGYGTQKKETLSGAVTAIGADDIVTTKTNNVISNLQGKMAGLLIRQKGGEPGVFDNSLSIRGFGTPLIVIDGVARGGRAAADATAELAQMNSDDIESVSILKDASASIYGMNAANGVIIVTTKKGTDGQARFSYSGMFSISMPTGLELTIPAYEYVLAANEMARNDAQGFYNVFSQEVVENYRQNKPGYTDTNYIDEVLKKQVMSQSHSLSVRGGNNKIQYFVSGAYSKDPGLLRTGVMFYDRINFRTNVTAQVAKNLKMNVGFSGRRDTRQNSADDFWSLFKALFQSERYIAPYALGTDPEDKHYSVLKPENKNLIAVIDPELQYRRWETFNGQAQIDLTYTVPFVEGLTVQGMADYNIRLTNQRTLRKSYQLYNYYTDTVYGTFNDNSIQNQMDLYTKGYFQFNANYRKQFGNHNLGVMVAAEGSMTRWDRLMGRRLYSDLYTYDILDEATATTATNSGDREYGRLAAYIGRVNYDYAGKYLLEVTGRYDGSYRYAPKKRWVLFPSVSAAWRISEESFIKDNVSWIGNLKLRASWGQSGIDQGQAFQYIPGYSGSTVKGYILNPGILTIGMYPPGVVNSDMSWVTSSTFNVGIDFDMPRGVFGLSLDYFQRNNTGVLGNLRTTVPNYFGASFPQVNINSDMNIGLDVELRHRGKIGNELSYMVTANTTFARQKRLHNEQAPQTTSWGVWRNGVENRYIGRSLLYQANGQYASLEELETAPLHGGALGNSRMLPGEFRIVDLNGDGVINANDQDYINWGYGDQGFVSGSTSGGSINPPLQYGLSFMGEWKGLSLSFLLQGAALYSVNFASNDVFGYGRYNSLHQKYNDRWKTANDMDDPFNPSTVWIPGKFAPIRRYPRTGTTSDNTIALFRPRGDYLRLKNVEIGYSLPKSFLSKIKVSQLRVFVNMTNIFTFTNKELKKLDPEKQERDYQGNMTYPIMKDVNFGINLSF